MAFISALLSLVSKKLSDLLQAVFGWSIAGLFGRLPSSKQTALSGALILAILWPLLGVGCVFPAAAAWTLAFVPLHEWLGQEVLRWVWIGLAVVSPVAVGMIIAWVAPSRKQRGGVLRTALFGYPLTLGLFLSFLLTLFIVLVLKLMAMARRWEDEHVYLQPKEGSYRLVLAQLAVACEKAGISVRDEPVPGIMRVPLRVLKWFARSGLDSIIASEPRMLRGEGVELYLYPADLLIRGLTQRSRHVRAAMVREMMQAPAYLTQDPKAQHIEDELTRTWELIARHRSLEEVRDTVQAHTVAIAKKLNKADVPYEDWMLLFTNLNLLERAMHAKPDLADDRALSVGKEVVMNEADPLPEFSTGALLQQAIEEARALLKAEIGLARDEALREISAVKRGAIAIAAAVMAGLLGLSTMLLATVLAIGPRPLPAIIMGAGLLVAAGVAGLIGYHLIPNKPLEHTQERLQEDAQILKERIA